MHILKDLHHAIGQTENKRSIQTGKCGVAKSKARYLAGNNQQLYRSLREAIQLGELKDKDIPKIVRDNIKSLFENTERHRASLSQE